MPFERYPDTYNGQPLCFGGLAAQKNYYALYLTCVYRDGRLVRQLREAFQSIGKKLDMGKSCIRFKKLDDLPLDAIGQIIAATPLDEFVAEYDAIRAKIKSRS